MKLSQLVDICDESFDDVQISGISFDDSLVKKGDLFFCLVGTKTDGHLFAKNAQDKGVAAIVAEKRLEGITVPIIYVKNTRSALSIASSRFFGEPSKRLKMIGVTGTNGKTTTTYIVKSILKAAGKKCGIIGTNAIIYGGKVIPATLTTPDPTILFSTLKDMADSGIEYVVMEVSAHALALNKLDGIIFDVAAFTNLSRDHMDFFQDESNYFAAKRQLFSKKYAKLCVINADDKHGDILTKCCDVPFLTYGCNNPSDIFAIDLSMSTLGLKYILNLCDDIAEIKFNLPGKFNMYNTLCAGAICHALGIRISHIKNGIRTLKKVDGRFNIINTTKCSIIIDFAHTDDGLDNILNAIREFAPKRIITVFGCGGDRDNTKRPIMGKIAAQKSDFCFLTSDNPRNESPQKIIDDILAGIASEDRCRVKTIIERKDAILAAIEFANEGDIVLIAGKGAERYQEIMGQKYDYNDEQYVLGLIEEKKI